MTNPTRHPFLEDLSDDVTLISTILRETVSGRENVMKIVKAGGRQYLNQKPRFLGTLGDRTYFEYDADLKGGLIASGLVSILRDESGKVVNLHIAFSPLGAVLEIAAGVSDDLAGEFEKALFL